MPIYEYQCTRCGEIFEAFQKIHDKPLSRCKFCHGRVEKLISQTSFQLKGSGWYLTDYARKSDKPEASEGSAGKSAEKSEKGNAQPSSTGKKEDSS